MNQEQVDKLDKLERALTVMRKMVADYEKQMYEMPEAERAELLDSQYHAGMKFANICHKMTGFPPDMLWITLLFGSVHCGLAAYEAQTNQQPPEAANANENTTH